MTDFAVRPDVASSARAALQEAIRVDPIRMAEAQLLLTEVLANAFAHSKAKTVRLEVANDVTGWRVALIHPSKEGGHPLQSCRYLRRYFRRLHEGSRAF